MTASVDFRFRSVFLRQAPGLQNAKPVLVFRALFRLSSGDFIESKHVFSSSKSAIAYRVFVLKKLLNDKKELDPDQWSVFKKDSLRRPYFYASDQIRFLDLNCSTKDFFKPLVKAS